jgi:photosystem II stability/assembly factor-like uncharacterized protein
MSFKRLAIVLCALSLIFSGCSRWKQIIQTEPQPDMLNTAMLFDKERGLAVGEFNITRYTKNGGKNWIATMGSKTHMFALYGCSMLDEKNVYATGNCKQAFCSKNGGENWYPMSDIEGNGKSISFCSPTEGWVSSIQWFATTNDRGKTWNPQPLPEGATAVEAICMTAPGTGYLVSERKDVFFTQDSGAHWEKRANPFPDLDGSFKPLLCRVTQGLAIGMKGDTGVIACIGVVDKEGKIILTSTEDGGKTWRSPVMRTLKKEPKTVNASANGIVSVLNKDISLTVFAR